MLTKKMMTAAAATATAAESKGATNREHLTLTAALVLVGVLGVGVTSLVGVGLVAEISAASSELDAEMDAFRVSRRRRRTASRRFSDVKRGDLARTRAHKRDARRQSSSTTPRKLRERRLTFVCRRALLRKDGRSRGSAAAKRMRSVGCEPGDSQLLLAIYRLRSIALRSRRQG